MTADRQASMASAQSLHLESQGPIEIVRRLLLFFYKNSFWGEMNIQKGELCVKGFFSQHAGNISMPEKDEKRSWVMVKRAPVLTFWAAVVAELLGFEHDEALTLGRAVAGLNA